MRSYYYQLTVIKQSKRCLYSNQGAKAVKIVVKRMPHLANFPPFAHPFENVPYFPATGVTEHHFGLRV